MSNIPDTGTGTEMGRVLGHDSQNKEVLVGVVSVAVPADANMPDVGSIIYLREDGSYTCPGNEKGDGEGDGEKRKAAADERSSSPPRKKMRLEPIEDVFKRLQDSRNQAASVSHGDDQMDIIEKLGLKFKNSKGIHGMLKDDDEEDERWADKEAAHAACAEVRADTDGAESIARSGPTTACALTTVLRTLFFPCQNPACTATNLKGTESYSPQSNMFTLNQLMPTELNGKKRDYCCNCFLCRHATGCSLLAWRCS
jgi:hypothetical protein